MSQCKKRILITGSTDGIGFEAAKILTSMGHDVLVHGRSAEKLQTVIDTLSVIEGAGHVEGFVADLSHLDDVKALAHDITTKYSQLDVLINNAGVFKTSTPVTSDGLDVRFVVNTLAPYLLTQKLLPLLASNGRVVNLSSAAQAPVDLDALAGKVHLSDDMSAYAQSKLAITMWSSYLANEFAQSSKKAAISFIAVNPGSLLATKMVKEGFGMPGNDIRIGTNILIKLALDDEFEQASGQYFDNDIGEFSSPHSDALNSSKVRAVMTVIEQVIHECLS